MIFHRTCGTSCVSLGAFYQTKLGFSHQLTNVTTAKVTETGGQGSRTTVGPHLSQGVLQGCIGLVWNDGWDSKQVFKLFKRVSVIFFSSILCICHLGDGAIDMCFPFFSSYLHAGPLSFACLFWAGSENFSSRAFASSISVSHCACPSKWLPLSRTVERDSNMFACLFVLDSTGIHCLGRQGACHV